MIENLFAEVKKELTEAGIPIPKNIAAVRINSRPRARLGMCKRSKNFPNKTEYTIEISRFVMDMDVKKIKDVVAHELLHTCPGCFNHGDKWKEYAKVLKEQYGYDITRTTKLEENIDGTGQYRKEEYKYVLKCNNCGQIFKRKRECNLTRHPEKYRCRKCGGSISRESRHYI